MISHQHRIVFVHIPKTAGTSIEAVLGHHGPDGVTWGAQDHRTLRQLQWPHAGLRPLASRDHLAEALRAAKARVRPPAHAANRTCLTRDQYASYLKFAVVRNPWARTWSWYRNVRSDALQQQRLGVPADIGFADFVATRIGTDLLRPQTHWLHDFRGRVGVDLVCRFEQLDRDFAEVCRRAGLHGLTLPRLNTGGGDAAYVEAYDDATRRLVAHRFRHEIDLFGYRFSSFASH